MAVLEVPFPSSCVNVPHTDGATLIATDDLKQSTDTVTS